MTLVSMPLPTILLSTAILLISTTSAQLSPAAAYYNGIYTLPGVGSFNTHLSADFATLAKLPCFLQASSDTIGPGNDPYSHIFQPKNVRFLNDGALSLFVLPKSNSPIPSAEIATKDQFLYGSVRTVAKVSSPAGTCNGIFFYRDDNHEIDIEIRTHQKRQVWYTNQALVPGTDETSSMVKQNVDLSKGYHEYRIDWVAGETRFYLDGRLQKRFNSNVGDTPAAFVWNNWASGGEWTGSLPVKAGAMKIQSIDAYFNSTGESSCP